MNRRAILALAAYAAIGVATFGHSAATNEPYCETPEAKAAGGCYGGLVIVGSFAGVFWPLYWSWEAWK